MENKQNISVLPVITFSFFIWYLLVWISIWFRFHIHSQDQSLNGLFANTLSKKSVVRSTKPCLKFIRALLRCFVGDKVVVESSQLILAQTSTFNFWCKFIKNDFFAGNFIGFCKILRTHTNTYYVYGFCCSAKLQVIDWILYKRQIQVPCHIWHEVLLRIQ